MKILVACEFSNTVSNAFRVRGHDVTSCDLLPSEGPAEYHYQGDVRDILHDGWDMIIAHPPCTYLSNAGVGWLRKGENTKRMGQMRDAAVFFQMFLDLPVAKVCVENPVMHKYAKECITRPKPTQYVQPYQFGHQETKRTGLWLAGLPPLTDTDNVKEAAYSRPAKERNRLNSLGETKDRWKKRSKTYSGIANAMAEQWGQA